ncbi:hypothetical protein [Methylobacterium oryzihabitans]|uniref:Uncharacterized protein n=1 Tax=Methylobacterium oryzihabitans TaxID=2499852 RepID=A0A3S2XNT8_9HYPH|nr:hypothetical protein [Methylobacterium oryzihabitans]RVU19327.1 hypothetical protein EOE48_07960 [Methylobacterium oryzihabitans]
MSYGPTWNSMFCFPVFWPFSGSVSQDLAPDITYTVPEIEKAILARVGSYGHQIGIISDALEAVIARLDQAPEGASPPVIRSLDADGGKDPVAEFRTLVKEVKAAKAEYRAASPRDAALRDAAHALARLKTVDPDGYRSLAAALPR